ncbi:MAG: zf-HC2 domain-containing protein [Gemmatimonadota bacterium]|nr:zf-HC2 domain-containing protein [Gemmatimonadota bacterium]MDH3422080.1 zf-HC2 domain-containing protein [Gemmatimonadota bacterium]
MTLFDSFKRLFGAKRNGDAEGLACEDALRLVHEFLDGELADVPHAQVEAHFEMCRRCYPHLHLERRFREAIQRACVKETASPELRSRVLQLVSEGRPDS